MKNKTRWWNRTWVRGGVLLHIAAYVRLADDIRNWQGWTVVRENDAIGLGLLSLGTLLLLLPALQTGMQTGIRWLVARRRSIKALSAEIEVLRLRCDTCQRECLEKTEELIEISEELSETTKKYKESQTELGKALIFLCGIDMEPTRSSLAVKFIDLADSRLAHDILDLFEDKAWNNSELEQISWRENPLPDYRIIMFTDHPNADFLKTAITEFNLLDVQQIGMASKEPGIEEDVTIIIFDRMGFGED